MFVSYYYFFVSSSLNSASFTVQIFTDYVRPIDLITSLYQGRQIIEPNQVISRIEVNAVPKNAEGYDENIHHPGMVDRFRRLLEGYLKGLGHPKGSEKLGISSTVIEANKNDKYLRPQHFVEAMTASPYLPIHNGKLNVGHGNLNTIHHRIEH